MKFQDKDVCSFTAHANGVVLKVVADKMLEAVDDYNKVAMYIYENELEQMIGAIDSPSKELFEPEKVIDFELSFNSAELDQSMLIFDASVIEDSPSTKRNRAYIFVGLEVLSKVHNRILDEKKRIDDMKAFDDAFKAMTGCKLSVADDSNQVVMIPA